MIAFKVGDLAWVGLLGAMAGSACSSSPSHPPSAFVSASVGPGNMMGVDDASACGLGADETWQIGNQVQPQPIPIANGTGSGGNAISVSCSVDASGGGYMIVLAATSSGTSNSGTLYVSGTVSASGTSTVTGSFTTAGLTLQSNNCTFSETYEGAAVPMPAGLPAQGRIWGHIDCYTASSDTSFGQGEDGGAIPRTCYGQADFLFENCN